MDWESVDIQVVTDAFNNPGGDLIFQLEYPKDVFQPGMPCTVVFTTASDWRALDRDGEVVEVVDADKLIAHVTRTCDWASWDEIIRVLADFGLDFTFANAIQDILFLGSFTLEKLDGRTVLDHTNLMVSTVDPRRVMLMLAAMKILSKRYKEYIESRK
jgi:predicted TIM-barrel fold metal-dependent hydrolase